MIYEFRTYTLKPGGVPKFEEIFGEALPHREKYSKLAAFWHTEVGPLNQVIHVWGYEDVQQRSEIRAAAAANPNWPPKAGHLIVKMESEIVMPGPFQKPIEPGNYGPVYEMRYYDAVTRLHARDYGGVWSQAPRQAETFEPFLCRIHGHGAPQQADPHLAVQGHESPGRDPGSRRGRRRLASAHWPGHCYHEQQDHAPRILLARPVVPGSKYVHPLVENNRGVGLANAPIPFQCGECYRT